MAAAPAYANPLATVPSAADLGDPLDFHATIDYAYSVESADVTREGPAATADGRIPTGEDLSFKQFRHTITPRAELGVYHDMWLSFALPIIIQQQRELSYADGIDAGNSSTIRDGLLAAGGFDSDDPTAPAASPLLFRGPGRSGIDQVHLGLAIAPMNQLRDRTKPTWKLGAEARLAAGKIMKFDRQDPDSETGVSRGVHELRLWTSVAKQRGKVLGWFELAWRVPLTTKDGSQYDVTDFATSTGITNKGPGQVATMAFGLELFALDDKIALNRISVDLGAKVEAHFEGREYTEMWEVFEYAGDTRGGGPLILDRDVIAPDQQAYPHPGISNIENYLETSARAAIRAELGAHARFGLTVDLSWRTDHAITFADAGVDLPTCGSGASPCETDNNPLVTPNSSEVNPLYVPGLDLVGHRYHSENNFGLVIGVEAQALF